MRTTRFAALALAGMLTALAGPASAQSIKLATLAPKGSPWHKALQDMAAEWSKLSHGKVRVRIYPGGIAGDEPDMVRKMRVGQIHAAAMTGAGLTQISQDVQALQMPMLLQSDAELDYVRNGFAPKLERALAANGAVVLNWADAGWVHFFTTTPVVRPDQLKPLKLFTWAGDTAYVNAWRDSGFNPVPLPATEIHTALSSGLIDAVPTTPVAALSFQWFGLAKNMTDVNWAPLVGGTVISTRMWRKIPKELHKPMMAASRRIGERLQREIRGFGAKAIEVMKAHGLIVHELTSADRALWEKGARQGYGKLIGKVVSAEAVAEVERLRRAYRASKGLR